MKKFIFIFVLLLGITLQGQEKMKSEIHLQSPFDFSTTISKLKNIFSEKNIQVFAEIDHSLAAKEVGLSLQNTKVLIVGNPLAGTALMQENQEVALHLPLKILVFERDNKVNIVYSKLEPLGKKYGLEKTKDIPTKIDNLMSSILKSVVKS